MTRDDLISRVRVLLKDQLTPYRYTEDQLVTYVNEGLAAVYRLRPDFLLESPDYTLPQLETGGAEVPSPVYPWYVTPLVDWIVGRAQARDDQYADEGVAFAFTEKMRAALISTGA